MAKKSDKTPTYYGGMSYKEFRHSGKVGLWMNDVAWAGRLFSKYPYWWKRLSFVVSAALIISVLSLAAIWLSILLRPPVLLLGVYPDARVVCMPRVVNYQGQSVPRHSSYNERCGALFVKSGLLWVVEEARKTGGVLPSSDPTAEQEDPDPRMRAASTSIDVVEQAMLNDQAEQQRRDIQSLTTPFQSGR